MFEKDISFQLIWRKTQWKNSVSVILSWKLVKIVILTAKMQIRNTCVKEIAYTRVFCLYSTFVWSFLDVDVDYYTLGRHFIDSLLYSRNFNSVLNHKYNGLKHLSISDIGGLWKWKMKKKKFSRKTAPKFWNYIIAFSVNFRKFSIFSKEKTWKHDTLVADSLPRSLSSESWTES